MVIWLTFFPLNVEVLFSDLSNESLLNTHCHMSSLRLFEIGDVFHVFIIMQHGIFHRK